MLSKKMSNNKKNLKPQLYSPENTQETSLRYKNVYSHFFLYVDGACRCLCDRSLRYCRRHIAGAIIYNDRRWQIFLYLAFVSV